MGINNGMQKIVFLEAVQNYGGARRSTLELAHRISDSYDVTIVDMFGSCVPFLQAIEEKHLDLRIIDKKNAPVLVGGGVSSNTIKKVFNYLKYIPIQIKLRKKLRDTIDDIKPNIIITNNLKTLSLITKRDFFKIVYFARGWGQRFEISDFRASIIKKKSDFFFTVSHATRHTLISRSIATLTNCHVVANGISSNLKFIENKKRNGLITCGGFLPSKGHHLAIEILKSLHDKKHQIKLTIIGTVYHGEKSQQYYEEVLQLVKKYNLTDYVSFLIDIKNVPDIMQTSDFFLHLSETEGMPRVVMEAMANGAIVLANAVGGVTDLVIPEYNGFLIHHNDIEHYTAKIEYLIKTENTKRLEYRTNAYSSILQGNSIANQVQAFKIAINTCIGIL